MTVRPTSGQALNLVDLPARQRSVYDSLAKGAKTDHEIAADTGLLIQSICGARNRLIELNLVEGTSLRRQSPWGYDCVVWRLKRQDPALAETDLRKTDPNQPVLL